MHWTASPSPPTSIERGASMTERLKAALLKARHERSVIAGPANASTSTGPRSEADVSRDLLPVPQDISWAAIPESSCDPDRLAQARITEISGESRASQVFDTLSAKLHRICAERSWSRIALTAPTRGCGTTTFALNLAFCFARRTDARVLLVDLHQRAPAIAARLGLAGNASLQSVLSQDRPLEEMLHRFGPNLLFAASRTKADQRKWPQSDAQHAMYLNRLQARYRPDVLLLDLPPVLEDDSAKPLLKLADAALLVASAEATTAEDLDEGARLVTAETAYLGAALNKSKDRSARSTQRELA